jgi:hypothetical protein
LLLGGRLFFFDPGASRRELNKHHIEKLSKRFRVSPAAFFRKGRSAAFAFVAAALVLGGRLFFFDPAHHDEN